MEAYILDIQSYDSLHLVKFSFNNQTLIMLSLELDEKIKIGKKVKLSIKPTAVAISKELYYNSSFENQLKTTVKHIENGKLLSSITLDLTNDISFESIITRESSDKLNLKIKDEIIAIIKASDISISEIIDV